MVELLVEENNAIEIKYVCYECKKKFTLDEMHDGKTIDDKLICESCYDKSYFTCDDCSEISHNDDSHSINDDKIVCENCNEDYFTCEICDDRMHIDARSEDVRGICGHCFENNYTSCDNCGSTIHNDDQHYNERYDNYLCSDCYHDALNSNLKSECMHILKFSDMSPEKSFNIFGVEIESILNDSDIELSNREELKHFSIVEDGSLNSGGLEFVTCPLPNTNEGKKILKTFCDSIGKKYLSIDSSCGLHIHFFFHRNLVTKDNIKKIIIAYRNLEELFFNMNPKSRRTNNYCKSLNNSLFSEMLKQSSIEEMLELFYEMSIRSVDSVPEDKYYKHRYFWVNFNSIFYRNTIEIRLHSGSISYDKIINWYNIHRILLEFCISSSYEEIENLNSEQFLNLLPEDLREYVKTRISKFKNHVELRNTEE